MGVPMANIHAPSVPSASANPTSTPTSATDTAQTNPTAALQPLIARKDALESELKALGAVLDSHNVSMTTPLTTPDDFPRADIDVPAIRTTRARILAARNDHAAAMRAIEPLLHAHFAAAAAASPSTDTPSTDTPAQELPPTFARVASVEAGSPAAAAGLAAGDLVAAFGGADWLNHEKLGRVAREVGASEGRAVRVVVVRGGRRVEMGLVPRRGWGGRGMLGCHLVPE